MAGVPTPESFARDVRLLLEELERRGRDPETFEFGLYMPTFAWPQPDAWERVRDHYWYMTWKYEDTEAAYGRTGPPPPAPPLTAAKERELKALLAARGYPFHDPIFTLYFMVADFLPAVRLSSRGVWDVKRGRVLRPSRPLRRFR